MSAIIEIVTIMFAQIEVSFLGCGNELMLQGENPSKFRVFSRLNDNACIIEKHFAPLKCERLLGLDWFEFKPRSCKGITG